MKKAIIIGATSGIGRAIAVLLHQKGYTIGIAGRRQFLLDELQRQFGFYTKCMDVSDPVEGIKGLQFLVNEMNEADLIIYSSGTGDLNSDLDFSIESKAIATNVSGFTAIACWAFNYFKERGGGQLVSISSVGGIRGSAAAPAYNASKAYQINYLEGLRQKVRKEKLPIVITDIRPGLVNTSMAKGEGLFWVAPVEKAARQMVAAIEKKKSRAYVTKRWKYVAGLLKIIPAALYERI